ncbi:MAG: hypothetical protein HRU17_19690 [Polyangiaceae bacterium]|nr:hypothetical protein [Polyangiaceae bacterium]
MGRHLTAIVQLLPAVALASVLTSAISGCAVEEPPPPKSAPLLGSDAGNQGRLPGVDATPGDSAQSYAADPGVGEDVPDLQLRGYLNRTAETLANTTPLVNFRLSDLKDQGANYVLVHIATGWCTSCQAAAKDIGLGGTEVVQNGGAVLELLTEGVAGQLPTDAELDAWITAHDIEVNTAAATDALAGEVFPSRDRAYIINLDDMKVVWTEDGLYADPTIGAVGLDTMLRSFL